MEQKIKDIYISSFGIDKRILDISFEIEENIQLFINDIEKVREYNQLKVITAMQDNKLSDSHFAGTTGYGYDDRGREILDAVYAHVFKAEAALVRHQIVSGTHALTLCLFGVLRPGDELLSITGKPYDTLEEVIGIREGKDGSLSEFGISYKQVDLLPDGAIDLEAVKAAVSNKTRMVLIQRSRGYAWRPALSLDKIEEAIKLVKKINPDTAVMVDNCYGEFVDDREPIEAGADLAAGSLIKNPGGGLAPTGGYIVGREDLVRLAACRLTAPGVGGEVGASLGQNRLLFQGLFLSPHVVAESLKGAVFCSALMERLGFDTSPHYAEKRSDIIQAVKFGNPDNLIAFCQGIQKGSPVDSFVTPQPWDMPGYDCPVIMAAGAFIQGSSMELSADAPVKAPFTAYMQGGLVYEHVKLGLLIALNMMLGKGIVKV